MKIKTRLYFLILSSLHFLILNCTGVNITSTLGVGAVTNPTPEYGNPFFLADKRGIVYHNNTVAGQISATAESKITGEACSKSVLYLVAWGDSSIESAKKAGKITKIASVEYEQFAILAALYHSLCTKVMGSNDEIASEPAKTDANTPMAKTPAKKGK